MGAEGGAGVDAPGGRPVVYNRSAATSTLGFDGGDDPWHQLHLLPSPIDVEVNKTPVPPTSSVREWVPVQLTVASFDT